MSYVTVTSREFDGFDPFSHRTPVSPSRRPTRKPLARSSILATVCATAAVSVFSSTAHAEPQASSLSQEVSRTDKKAGDLLQKIGGKVLRITQQKSNKQYVKSRLVEGNMRSISFTRDSPASKETKAKGTYILTATFNGKAQKPKLSKLVQVSAIQDGGPRGPYASLDLRKCAEGGFAFTGGYAGADGPEAFAHGHTQPTQSEHKLDSPNLSMVSSHYNFVLKGAINRLAIRDALLPPFPATPDQPAVPVC